MVGPTLCSTNERQGLRNEGIELADVVRRFGAQYRSRYGHLMMPSHERALSNIAACCTEDLGGRRYRCDDCGECD